MANEKIVNRENLKAFRQAYDTRLENGTLVPEKSQTAKNLLPVSSASGSTQTAPFINQGTATNNNDSQAVVDTGTLGQHLEKQGHTLAVNQLAKEFSEANWGIYGATGSITDGVLSMTATEQFGRCVQVNTPVIANHKYFMSCDMYLTSDTNDVSLNLYYADKALKPLTSGWHHLQDIVTVSTSGGVDLRVIDSRDSGWDEIKAKNIILIDLTQMFNDDIPQDLLDNPSNFYRYYNGSLAYNTGTLVNSNGRYLVNGGQNVWDEVATSTGYIDNMGNVLTGYGTRIASTNLIQVIPNRKYYFTSPYAITSYGIRIAWYDKDKNLISVSDYYTATNKSPANACYMRFNVNQTGYNSETYKHDITVSLYYEGEDYSQYVPYEEPKVYDTGDEVLRQAGSVKDYKEPNGTIHRLVGSVDLSTLSWTLVEGEGYWFYRSSLMSDAKVPSSGATIRNCISEKYIASNQTNIGVYDNEVSYSASYIYVRTNDKTVSPTGLMYYELKDVDQTTEQGTPFSENMDINDMGNMAWYSAYTDENTNTLVSVPQGCKIFYPAWYVGFIDSLGQRADIEWSADNVVSQSELASDKTELQGVDTQLKNAIGGTLRHCLAIQEAGVSFEDTDFVDLGELNWSKTSVFYTVFNDMSGIKGISTQFLVYPQNEGTGNCIQIRQSDKNIYFLFEENSIYANMTPSQFKNAMKGVLLAYEKA